MTDHAAPEGWPATVGGCLSTAVLGHDHLAAGILNRLSFAEVILEGMTDQAVYGLFRLRAGTADVAGVITGVAGIAAGKLGLAERVGRHFLQVVDNIVTVTHRVDAVLHAVFFGGIDVIDMIHL